MECPKCHTKLDDNQTVCPRCHKVLLLECPNCKNLSESAVCEKCGYTIVVKCSKCGKINPVTKEKCSKCGFPVKTSLAYQECESDDFASIIVKFGALKNIRRLLKSQELYSKFYYRLKNLLLAQLKGVDCKLIIYNDVFVINMNKELSFATSSNKAARLAIKVVNAFSELNNNIVEELSSPLNLSLTIVKKSSENLQDLIEYENNVKLLNIKKSNKKYLLGLKIILDQDVCDNIGKNYKTDSLYSIEENGRTIVFYEIVLDDYVLPPSKDDDENIAPVHKASLPKSKPENEEKDIYAFKVFDINAKCTFDRVPAASLLNRMSALDFVNKDKILAIRGDCNLQPSSQDLVKFFESKDYKVLSVTCTESMNYKPWGFFDAVLRDFWGLSFHNKFNQGLDIKNHKALFDLLMFKPVKAMSPEDARFAYMEHIGKFLSSLQKTVILVEGFEYLDDTSIQTLELYFDRFKNIKTNFVFVTSSEHAVHTKIKGLLRTPCYTEITLKKSSIDSLLSTLKSDAADFIQSFYFEKIRENFDGSLLYFETALSYLKETNVLLDFDNKLIIKSHKSVILPSSLKDLYKAKIKHLSKNMDLSLILAYSAILSSRIDFQTLAALEIKDIEKNAKLLQDAGLARVIDGIIYINNYNLVSSVVLASLKKDILEFLCKNILAKIGKGLDDTSSITVMGKLSCFKEEYLLLWRNSQFGMNTGDYDAYLKNCLGFLSLVEHIGDLDPEAVENNKKEVYSNILLCLYSYSPAKIYYIENLLLADAIKEGDDEKIVKLSNLMLQGALISSNYTDALSLLHNILSRMQQPVMLVDGAVNTKFLLLSLVNIEILYNIGDFRQCADTASEILDVLTPEILDKVKPASFSANLFVSHILETFRLAGFAKLYLLDKDLDEFFEKIKLSLNAELPEKDCILTVKDYLAGKEYAVSNIESASPFSKVIFLILQEISVLKDDYKRFAQNIYQAKLLAADLHQYEFELFCDLLIAYAYSKIGIPQKAQSIYTDVLNKAEKSAMFNTLTLARYFAAKLKLASQKTDEAFLYINDTLAMLQKFNNQSKIIYALFEKLYIQAAQEQGFAAVDVESENQKLLAVNSDNALSRILSD